MLIWTILFVVALICVIILMFYLNVELNEMDKTMNQLAKDIENYYEN